MKLSAKRSQNFLSPLMTAKKVIEMQTMNFLQQTLAYFAGVLDLRGQHIPVTQFQQ